MHRPRRLTVIAALFAAAMSACGDDDGPTDGAAPADGGAGDASSTTDAWAPLEPAPPALPMPPALPVITPCPAGWTEASEGGLTWCEPWAEDVSASCAVGEVQRPGEAGCVAIGSPCPSGEWPTDLPVGATVVYVRAGATGGDGSMATPYGTIGEAVAASPSGATIAIGAGTYDEDFIVSADGLVLRGVCAERTRLTLGSGRVPALAIDGTNVVVRDLTIGPTTHYGLVVIAPGEAEVRGVVLERNSGGSVAMLGGRATFTDIAIEDPRPHADGSDGRGLQMQGGAEAVLERSSIRGSKDVAVIVEGAGTALRIVDTAVRDTTGHSVDGSFGRGINVSTGARAEILRSAFHRQREQAVYAAHAGTTVRVDQASFADTPMDALTGAGGLTLGAHRGASIEVRRTTIVRSEGGGILSDEPGATVLVEDVVIRDTGGDEPPGTALAVYAGGTGEVHRTAVLRAYTGAAAVRAGSALLLEDVTLVDVGGELAGGVLAKDSATITATRLSLARARGVGVFVDVGSRAIVTDVSIVRTDAAGASPGRAAEVWGGHFELHRASIEDAVEAALLASDGASLVIEDATIRDGRSAETGYFGRGISVQLGATAEIDRIVLSNNTDTGIFVGGAGTSAHARDVVVERTRPLGNGEYGRGISVQYGATLTLERAALTGNHELGICALGEWTAVALADVRVEGTLARPCAAAGCDPGGHGIGVYDGALIAERIEVADSALCGVHLAREGQLDLAHGVVRGNAIGACIQIRGYDVARLMNDVQYVDNGLTLDTQALPIPEPAL